MMRWIATMTLLALLLMAPARATEIIFSSCHGDQTTEFAGGKTQPLYLSAETSIKIDLDNRLFFWTYDLPTNKSCSKVQPKTTEELSEWLKHGECTNVELEELSFRFKIKTIYQETDGTIDRVTGKLFAKTEAWNIHIDNPQISSGGTISWTSRLITCTPAALQF